MLILNFFLILISFSAFAEEQKTLPQYGLAMHGQTKYSGEDTYLSYVNQNAPKGGTLKIAAIGTFDSLNPYSIKGIAAQNMNLVYDRLMRRVWDEPFTLYPLIAQNIEVADDRSSITFHINPKARFHDKTPITTEDVEYSYKTLKEYGRPNMRNIYKLVSEVKILNPHKIKFTLGDGYDRETIMILAMMPILSKAWWSNHKFDSTITKYPLLNGPYRIKESKVGHKITYERVKDYWAKDLFVNKGQYNFDEITYEYFRDDLVALEAFKKGDLNLRREWNVKKWQTAYEGMIEDNIKLNAPHERPERAHGFIFNLRRPPFDDINIRKALYLAFDYGWVSKNLFHNEFKRIKSYYPNSDLDGSGKISEKSYSQMREWRENINDEALEKTLKRNTNLSMRNKLRQANDLLKKSGWIIENGKLINKTTKQPLTFEIIISTPQEEKIALTYKRNLERLGVDMRIRMLDSSTFQKRKNIYDYDMISFYWQNSLSPGTEQTLYWSCKAAKEPARFNFSGICNPALDYFAKQMPNAKTYFELTNYAHIIDRILLSEYISIPLFYKGVDYIAHHKSIKHTNTTPIYGVVLESWWKDK